MLYFFPRSLSFLVSYKLKCILIFEQTKLSWLQPLKIHEIKAQSFVLKSTKFSEKQLQETSHYTLREIQYLSSTTFNDVREVALQNVV